MPNGGSDCCGTCWFNGANDGKQGYREGPRPEEIRCTIRGFGIENQFWTYCANHPHHNPGRIEVPIGPIYVTDDYPNTRRVCKKSPDTEEIRSGLLDLIVHIEEVPRVEYPTPTQLDEEIIKQLMEFREKRAVPALRKIFKFNPLSIPSDANPFGRNRVITVALAIEALTTIEGDCALDEVEIALRSGLSNDEPPRVDVSKQANQEDSPKDPLAPIRYHAVLGMKYCNSERAKELLCKATNDPHPKISAFACEILNKKQMDT